MTRAFKTWFAGLVLTAAFVSVSVQWLDRPIALWVYNIFGGQRIPTQLADRVFSIPFVSAIVFVICGLAAIMGRRFSKLEAAVAMCTISTLAVTIIKDQLKFAFGRTWPDTWGPGIVSFLRDNAYRFHFFQSEKSFESFPSGHAAVAAAVVSVVWIFFPKRRMICAIGVVAADIGLVALNLHFLSDVVAGSFVGVSTGLFTVALWRASELGMQVVKLASVQQTPGIVRGGCLELPSNDDRDGGRSLSEPDATRPGPRSRWQHSGPAAVPASLRNPRKSRLTAKRVTKMPR
jgi:membrane-associated phospholipid phosphatase